jgi:ribosomal protein S18 acetylase RimI-like enzyme
MTVGDMELRAAKSDDIPVLMEMVAAMPEAAALPPALKASAADWQRDLGRGFDGIVAIKDGHVVGAAITSSTAMPGLTAPVIELLVLYVLEPYRRQGIAKALLNHVKERAQQQGAAFVRLSVTPDTAAALGLYLDAGFKWSPHTLLLWIA